MSTVNQKQQFLQAVREVMGELGRLTARGDTIAEAFAARGYDAAASDPVTDAQLDAFGVIVYDLGTAINLLQALSTLMNDATRRATVNKWRQV